MFRPGIKSEEFRGSQKGQTRAVHDVSWGLQRERSYQVWNVSPLLKWQVQQALSIAGCQMSLARGSVLWNNAPAIQGSTSRHSLKALDYTKQSASVGVSLCVCAIWGHCCFWHVLRLSYCSQPGKHSRCQKHVRCFASVLLILHFVFAHTACVCVMLDPSFNHPLCTWCLSNLSGPQSTLILVTNDSCISPVCAFRVSCSWL